MLALHVLLVNILEVARVNVRVHANSQRWHLINETYDTAATYLLAAMSKG